MGVDAMLEIPETLGTNLLTLACDHGIEIAVRTPPQPDERGEFLARYSFTREGGIVWVTVIRASKRSRVYWCLTITANRRWFGKRHAPSDKLLCNIEELLRQHGATGPVRNPVHQK